MEANTEALDGSFKLSSACEDVSFLAQWQQTSGHDAMAVSAGFAGWVSSENFSQRPEIYQTMMFAFCSAFLMYPGTKPELNC